MPELVADSGLCAGPPRLRLVFLPNPNSPSGTMIPPEQILELAERLPCPLLVDEAYVDFAETNCLALVAQNAKIMVSRRLSKSYALAGLRFGYLVAQPALIAELVKVKDSYNCDALAIAGATAAIGDQAWRAENRAASWPPASGWSSGCGNSVLTVVHRRPTLSGARIRSDRYNRSTRSSKPTMSWSDT